MQFYGTILFWNFRRSFVFDDIRAHLRLALDTSLEVKCNLHFCFRNTGLVGLFVAAWCTIIVLDSQMKFSHSLMKFQWGSYPLFFGPQDRSPVSISPSVVL